MAFVAVLLNRFGDITDNKGCSMKYYMQCYMYKDKDVPIGIPLHNIDSSRYCCNVWLCANYLHHYCLNLLEST